MAADEQRSERLRAWQATVDDAIAEMRRTEGFDGTTRVWRTLGDVVGMRSEPAPKRQPVVIQRVSPCEDCGTPKLWDAACETCKLRAAAAKRVRDAVYRRLSLQGQRRQRLAAQDVGRLAG